MQKGPVVIAHHVGKLFKNYKRGIFNDTKCDGKLNHSALAVGYNLKANPPYIVVKNAWGKRFGENGYYRIALGNVTRNSKGICKMFSHPFNVVPLLDN